MERGAIAVSGVLGTGKRAGTEGFEQSKTQSLGRAELSVQLHLPELAKLLLRRPLVQPPAKAFAGALTQPISRLTNLALALTLSHM
jgi:hypothetical protein